MKKLISLALALLMLLSVLVACDLGGGNDTKRAKDAVQALRDSSSEWENSYDGEMSKDDIATNEKWLGQIIGEDVTITYAVTFGMDDLMVFVFKDKAHAKALAEAFDTDGLSEDVYQDGAIFVYGDIDDFVKCIED